MILNSRKQVAFIENSTFMPLRPSDLTKSPHRWLAPTTQVHHCGERGPFISLHHPKQFDLPALAFSLCSIADPSFAA
jgi:hypothetical protein